MCIDNEGLLKPGWLKKCIERMNEDIRRYNQYMNPPKDKVEEINRIGDELSTEDLRRAVFSLIGKYNRRPK